MTRKSCLKELDETIENFILSFQNIKLEAQVYDLWTVKDILGHVTYWHEYYANVLEALSHHQTPKLFNGKFMDLNAQGIVATKKFSKEELIKKLKTAHQKFSKYILDQHIKQIPYKENGRINTPIEYLTLINGHIRHHNKDIKKFIIK